MFTQLPRFEANQVLSNKHLNQIIEYLEEQGRLTRNALQGYGIVSGLEVRRNGTNSLSISEGVGLTSYGYLVMPDTTNAQADARGKRWITYDKKRVFNPANLLFPYKLGNDATATNYEFLAEAAAVLQLVPASQANNADVLVTPLVPADLTNRVVVLFVQIQVKELQSCEADSCMELGKQWNYSVVPLLLTIAQANAMVQREYSFQPVPADNADRDPLLNPAYHLPDIPLIRPNIGAATDDINTAGLAQVYKEALNALLAEINETRYTRIDESLSLLLQTEYSQGPIAALRSKLQQLLTVTNSVARQEFYQYAYSFIKDVCQAYRELQDAVFDYAGFEMPKTDSFPHHLRLGAVPAATGAVVNSMQYAPNTYRHGFTGSRIQDNQRQAWQRVVAMYQRLLGLMAAGFSNLRINDIRVTPSVEGANPMGKRAIPFYYQPASADTRPAVAAWWNPEWQRMAKANRVLSYYDNANTVSRSQFLAGKPTAADEQLYLPLLYSHFEQNFYRVEGHISAMYTDVFKTISEYITQYQLSFDLQLVRLNKQTRMLIRDRRILFDDLESLYNVVREEIGSLLSTELNYFSNIRLTKRSTNTRAVAATAQARADTPSLPAATTSVPDDARFYRTLGTSSASNQFFSTNYKMQAIDLGITDSIYSLYNRFEGKVALLDVVGIIGGAGGITIGGVKSTPAAPFVSKMIAAITALQQVLATPFHQMNITQFEQRLKTLEQETKSFILYAKSQSDAALRDDSNITKGELLDYLDRIFYEPDFEKIGALATERNRREERLGSNNFLKQYMALNPGLEHLGGVWKGGTLIIVFNENGVVVGDFCLPYRAASGVGATQFVLGVLKTILFAGQILDTNGVPVKKATVTLNDEPLPLDESSSFKKSVTPNTFLLIRAEAEGFETRELKLMAQEEDILQNIVLFTKAQELKVNLILSITDTGNKAIAGATATLNDEKINIDNNGNFKGAIKAGANFILGVSANGFKPFTQAFATLEKDVEIKVQLTRLVKFTGTLLDPNQRPLLNAKVLINGQLLPLKENKFETQLESKVAYNIVIEAEGLQKFAETITPADADINRTFQLARIATLQVRLGIYIASKVVFNPIIDRLRTETILRPTGVVQPRIDILRGGTGGVIPANTNPPADTNPFEFLASGVSSTVNTKAQTFNADLKVFSSEEIAGQHRVQVTANAVSMRFAATLGVSDMDVMILIPARQQYKADGLYSVVVRADSGADNMKALNAFFVKQFSTPNIPWFNRSIDFRFYTKTDAEDFAARLKAANVRFLTLVLG